MPTTQKRVLAGHPITLKIGSRGGRNAGKAIVRRLEAAMGAGRIVTATITLTLVDDAGHHTHRHASRGTHVSLPNRQVARTSGRHVRGSSGVEPRDTATARLGVSVAGARAGRDRGWLLLLESTAPRPKAPDAPAPPLADGSPPA